MVGNNRTKRADLRPAHFHNGRKLPGLRDACLIWQTPEVTLPYLRFYFHGGVGDEEGEEEG
jgi:hypothetical protein